ncbi:MAG: alpha/beta hydrolase [Steroidobacteraceae bacterium]|jgi:pimeloyl-ACP methyl ester carboxylesterase|nr:alpha/beta hydrolase [Steroidobacteraceae bacterium]
MLIDTPHGVLGALGAGDAGPAVLLLPQSPLGSRQYVRVLPRLAAAGFRAIAPDLMGYGDSDPRQRHWSIEDFAGLARDVLDRLGITSAVVVAGHFAAQAAIELAASAPQRVVALVLDGTPLYATEIRERLRAAPPPPPASDDGSHAAEMWRRTTAFLKAWDPSGASLREPGTAGALRALYFNFVRTNYEPAVTPAIAAHDTAGRLQLVSRPVLALTADGDSLKGCHEQVLALCPRARGHRFTGRHPLQALDGGDADRWLEVVLPFIAAQAGA